MNVVTPSSTGLKHNLNTVWTEGNDGIGSGLDADLLDGKHASDFASSADLSGKVDKQTYLGNTIDLNTVKTSGFYRLNSQTKNLVNAPTGIDLGFGQMLVISGGGDTISQLAMPYNNSRIYVRNGNTVNNSNGTWHDWATVANTSDIGNGTIVINQNGAEKGRFTVNQTGTTTINLTDTNTDTNTTYSAGTGLNLSGTTFSVNTGYTSNGQNYAVSVDTSTNKLYVNVPWRNDNTTYNATDGIKLEGGYFKHANAATTAKDSGLYKIAFNKWGHITSSSDVTKADITGLGISSSDHNHDGRYIKMHRGGSISTSTTGYWAAMVNSSQYGKPTTPENDKAHW